MRFWSFFSAVASSLLMRISLVGLFFAASLFADTATTTNMRKNENLQVQYLRDGMETCAALMTMSRQE
jgi:hypothetical protein